MYEKLKGLVLEVIKSSVLLACSVTGLWGLIKALKDSVEVQNYGVRKADNPVFPLSAHTGFHLGS